MQGFGMETLLPQTSSQNIVPRKNNTQFTPAATLKLYETPGIQLL